MIKGQRKTLPFCAFLGKKEKLQNFGGGLSNFSILSLYYFYRRREKKTRRQNKKPPKIIAIHSGW